MRRFEGALVVMLCSLIQNHNCQLFRFCHRGVFHQIQEQDCPYGLLFNEQLQIPCFYTMNTADSAGGSGNVPRIWPTLCEDSYLFMPQDVTDETVGDGFFLAKKNGELRMIQFTSPTNDSDALANLGDLVSFQSCEDRCYRNIFEDTHSSILYTSSSHEASDSLESPHQISRPKLSNQDATAITDQTLRLGDYLFDQIGNPDENPGPKLRITELFKRSIKILSKSCQHPFISSNFVNRVLYGFLFLVTDSGVGEIEDISVEEFEEIMVALNGCDEKNPDFRLEGVVCESNAIVKEVIKILPNGTEYTAPFQLNVPRNEAPGINSDYDIPPNEGSTNSRGRGTFPYDELDVFTEAAWSAVQVTHATCFATFKPNVNMHHRYVSAMEQLFSGKIQDRWRNPTILMDPRMWGTWFLADVDLAFVNLQACIRAAYLDAPFTMRLDRPIDPIRSRATTSGNGGSSPPSSPPAAPFPKSQNPPQQPKPKPQQPPSKPQGTQPPKGAPPQQQKPAPQQATPKPTPGKKRVRRTAESDMEAYWNSYHASGGIRYRLANSIQCFQNPDDRDAAVQLLKDQCTINTSAL